MRRIELDILKGILIMLVVIGHALDNMTEAHKIIFWFHMPAFLMVSGYLLNDQKVNGTRIKQICIRYCVPYLFWSILFYVLFLPEHPLKNIARIIWGGVNNTTVYSYPFWYINAIFVIIVFFTLVVMVLDRLICRKKAQIGLDLDENHNRRQNVLYWVLGIIAASCYFLVHFISVKDTIPVRLPFSLDAAIGCIPYVFIGYYLKRGLPHYYYPIMCLIPLIFIILQLTGKIDYVINLKQVEFSHWFLDIIIPTSFTLVLYWISLFVRNTLVGKCLCGLGECSLTIFFIHAAVLYVFREYSIVGAIILALLLGWIIQKLSKQNKALNFFVLGVYNKGGRVR